MNPKNPHNRKPVFDDNRVHVMEDKCETCIFRPKGEAVWLESGRLKEMVETSVKEGGAITCHKTMYEEGYVQQAICHGYWEGHATRVPALRLAINLGAVKKTDGRE